jgi:hypothetical protein
VGYSPLRSHVVRIDVNARLAEPPNAASPSKPAKLPTTGEERLLLPPILLAMAALLLVLLGILVRRQVS